MSSNLPTQRVTVRFPPNTLVEESYQLLELPPEILKAVEGGEVVPLTIKGRPHDDAVLCTANKTYALRTVAISNSLCILRPPATAAHPTLQIRDVCHQVLECVPAPGRVERLRSVLKESAWGGLGSTSSQITPTKAGNKRKRDDESGKRYTLAQLQSIIQASDAELAAAIKEINAVEVDGHMLLLPPVHLAELIGVLLKLLTVHCGSSAFGVADSLESDKGSGNAPNPECSAADIFAAMSEHDVDAHFTSAVMRHFGTVENEIWAADVKTMVGELGRGLLVATKDKPTPIDNFLANWREAAGDEWARHIDLAALSGNYLLDDPPPTAMKTTCKMIRFFPYHTLPSHVATRFTDLFLTRSRWRPDDMTPFLRGLYPQGDNKAKDKLIAKFVRVVKEKDGAWWYPRRTG